TIKAICEKCICSRLELMVEDFVLLKADKLKYEPNKQNGKTTVPKMNAVAVSIEEH
ncbi:hypothetical protein A28LD_0620, partial [Idiomarina sp. A28L]